MGKNKFVRSIFDIQGSIASGEEGEIYNHLLATGDVVEEA